MHFQDLIQTLNQFWGARGCLLVPPYNSEVGAGTFNPHSFLRAIGPEPWNVAYVEPCRRPTDGRYGDNPNRLQQFHQFQVILKPSPLDIQSLYLESLRALGTDPLQHDIRFVEDDWESPTLGAWGLGWQVWLDGLEISQFTYFQQVGGIDCKPVSGELTYGLERIAMYLQNVDDVYDLQWNDTLRYGDLFRRAEWEWSTYNFESADIDMHRQLFDGWEAQCLSLLAADSSDGGNAQTSGAVDADAVDAEKGDPVAAAATQQSRSAGPSKESSGGEGASRALVLPAYDLVIKCSHLFNVLDARGAIGVTERQRYIGRVRKLARGCAEAWLAQRTELGFPLLQRGKGIEGRQGNLGAVGVQVGDGSATTAL